MMSRKTAQHVQCPHCGYRYTLPFKPVERQILRAIEKMERNSGKATTNGIATQLYLSHSQTFRHLAQLESRGEIVRIGTKSGWRKAA